MGSDDYKDIIEIKESIKLIIARMDSFVDQIHTFKTESYASYQKSWVIGQHYPKA